MSVEYVESKRGNDTRDGGRDGRDIGRGAGYRELQEFALNVMALSGDEKDKLRLELDLLT